MSTNYGFLAEKQLAYDLNRRLYDELSEQNKHLITSLFGVIDKKELIKCIRTEESIKPDLIINYMGQTKTVSIKTGDSTYIHQEGIESFIKYLRSLGISDKTQRTILLFQYGDGTMTGKGVKRHSEEKLAEMYAEEIRNANLELNEDNERIWKIVKRAMFKGIDNLNLEADAIMHIDNDKYAVACEEQVEKHIKRKNWNFYTNLHIGPLFFRPHARYVDKKIINEKYRHIVNFHWAHLDKDILYISKKYNSNVMSSKPIKK